MTANVDASVRARLRNRMHDTGLEFQFLLTRYACERFLYRLGASPIRDRCILKGASLWPYRWTSPIERRAMSTCWRWVDPTSPMCNKSWQRSVACLVPRTQ